MPTATAHRAAAKIKKASGMGARCRPLPATSQSRAAAAEAQVPGPGRRNPAPRNVPTAQAQPVFFGRAGSLIAGRTGPHPFNLFQQLGIEYRRGDPVGPAGPFPQVDGFTMLAAEGKILIF